MQKNIQNNIYDNKNPIAKLELAIEKNDIEFIKSIFDNTELSKDIDLSKKQGPLTLACMYGNLEIVKYLLTSKNIDNYTDINSPSFLGFQIACFNGRLDIVKYLTSSPELKQHIEIETIQDIGFMTCLESNKIEILKYFVVDLNIERNRIINLHLHKHPNYEVEKMFKIRDFNKELKFELHPHLKLKKKLKI